MARVQGVVSLDERINPAAVIARERIDSPYFRLGICGLQGQNKIRRSIKYDIEVREPRMGWFNTYLNRLASAVSGAPPVEFTYASSVRSEVATEPPGEIRQDECYIELFLESLRLKQARRFATRFNGVVYSFVTLNREASQKAQLSAVSKPDKLTELDEGSIGKVITVSKQMMAATPYRGGVVSLELGLFAVRSGNVLSPVLNYVTKVSQAAGISYVGAIKPFLPLITEGMDLITGQASDTALEVGVDTDITPTKGGVMAIIAMPRQAIDTSQLLLSADGVLKHKGVPLDCGYATFSLRAVSQKADFGEIPELRERYEAVQAAIRANSEKEARAAFGAFRLAAIASPDLIPRDCQALVAKAKAKVDLAFEPQAALSSKEEFDGSLYALNLYD